MKTLLTLLLTLAVGFIGLAQTKQPIKARPKVKTMFETGTYPRLIPMTSGLTAKNLRAVYGKALRVKKIIRNVHDPAKRDTLFAVNTGADHLEIFGSNSDSSLEKASFTSQKVAFGYGVRIGITKAAFCKKYQLPTAFDAYNVTDEGGTSIYFLFRNGVLSLVEYDAGWAD